MAELTARRRVQAPEGPQQLQVEEPDIDSHKDSPLALLSPLTWKDRFMSFVFIVGGIIMLHWTKYFTVVHNSPVINQSVESSSGLDFSHGSTSMTIGFLHLGATLVMGIYVIIRFASTSIDFMS